MSEQFPADSTLEALSGQVDALTGVTFPAKGEGLDWYVSFVKCIYRLMRNVGAVAGLRVYKSGTLTYGIRAGAFYDGATLRTVASVEGRALTASATNYVYLLADGTLTTSVAGFPDAATVRHVPLATIVTDATTYTADDVVDCRGRVAMRLAGPVTATEVGSTLATLWPAAVMTVGSESSDTIAVTVQVNDAKGLANANRFVVHAWLADSAYGGEATTPPSGTVSVTTGTLLKEETTKKRWRIVTNAGGAATMSIGESGAATWYLNVEIDGRVYSSAAIAFV